MFDWYIGDAWYNSRYTYIYISFRGERQEFMSIYKLFAQSIMKDFFWDVFVSLKL